MAGLGGLTLPQTHMATQPVQWPRSGEVLMFYGSSFLMPQTTDQAGYVKVSTVVLPQVALKRQEAFILQGTTRKENARPKALPLEMGG